VLTRVRSVYDDFKFLASPRKKAFYTGWNGHANLGDEVLLMAFRELFDRKMVFYEKGYIGKALKHLYKGPFDYVFLGGGTLVHRSVNALEAFKTQGRKKIVFGTGVANPEYWSGIKGSYSNIEGWVKELNKSDYIGVRGPLSKELLTKWGVAREVKVIGDPALFFLRSNITKKKKRKVLGVNAGLTGGMLWGGSDDRFLAALSGELKALGKRGWSFKFFPVCPKDIGAIETLMEAVREYGASCVKNYLDLKEFMQEMDDVDVFVGEKLHSVILAMCAHTPGVMLEYRPKCRDFMMSMGLGELNIKTDEITGGSISDRVEALYSRLGPEQERLHERGMFYKKLLISEAESVCSPAAR